MSKRRKIACLRISYALCDELQSAQPLKFQPLFLGMFYMSCMFQILE